MIQQLFFPEKIKNFYLFSQKRVGLHITSEKVYATVLVASGDTFKIVSSLSLALSSDKETLQEKTSFAISELLKKIGSYDQLIVTISSTSVMFKELSFPFVSKEKIALVLRYQLEPFLPFPLSEASFDFCITDLHEKENNSTIVAAATQTKYLREYLHLFSEARVTPSAVTVDILDFYGLYAITHEFTRENHALVVVDDSVIHIAYLKDGNLKTIRSVQSKSTSSVQTFQAILFTLQSFSQEYGQPEKIVFVADDSSLPGKTQEQLGVKCEQFSLINAMPSLKLKIDSSINPHELNMLSLSAAYPSSFTTNFTLATEEAEAAQTTVFKQQVIITAILTGVLLCAMATHTLLQIHTLSAAIDKTKESVLKDLKKNFPTIKSSNLIEVVKKAKQIVSKEEEIWFSFSNQTRRSFLKYLYELSIKIETDSLGLFLKKMAINKDNIMIEGSVRSFDALTQLEQQLKATNLFVYIPELQKLEFSESLTIKSQEDLA